MSRQLAGLGWEDTLTDDAGATDTTTDTGAGDDGAPVDTGTDAGDSTARSVSPADTLKAMRAELAAAHAELTKARREAGGLRGRLRTTETERDSHAERAGRYDATLSELGIEDAEKFDPKAFAEEYRITLGRLRSERLANQVMRAAGKVGANADLLLDSTSFQENARQLDPSADDYATQVEALVAKTVEASPAYRAGQAPPVAVSGAEIPGGSGQKVTDAEIQRLYAAGEYAKIAELVDSGQAANLLGQR